MEPREGGFQRNTRNPLETDVVVVDEASMIDLVLAHHLLQAVPLTATLLLVGDADQLPPVGPGSVLKDLLSVPTIPSVRLTTIFRQAAQSCIVASAHAVNGGVFPTLSAERGRAQDFYFSPKRIPSGCSSSSWIWPNGASRHAMTLTHLRTSKCSPRCTGRRRGGATQRRAPGCPQSPTPDATELLRGGRVFRLGDRVLQMVNDYEKSTFNGDLGRIVAIEPSDQIVAVRIDDRDVRYDFSDLDELSLAYAMTVHKSQGSEYPCVILPIHTIHYPMLQRNLLYTALTRAKKLLVLVGTKKAIAIAIRNDAIRRRYSCLAARLWTTPLRRKLYKRKAGVPGKTRIAEGLN